KNVITLWLIVGNAGLLLWLVILYAGRRQLSPILLNILVLLQVLVFLNAGFGLYMVARGVPFHPAHLMYGVLNALVATLRVGLYGQLARAGSRGLLWHAFLAVLAIALVARS